MIGDKKGIAVQKYGRGFDGLIAGDTSISRIDGTTGRLWIRGYPLAELCGMTSFEEASYLIIHGELPESLELKAWKEELLEWRTPPKQALDVLKWLPNDAHPLMKYRTMLSVAACLMPEGENTRIDAQWRRPARILSWTAGLAAAAIRHMKNSPPLPHNPDLCFTDNFLWQSLEIQSSNLQSRAFEVSMIAQAEHGLHAAALAALVVISTGADLGSAVLAGMGALSGTLHGGANQTAFEMLHSLKSPDQAKHWVSEKLAENFRFPGFGHRVYKTHDPRVAVLEPWAEKVLRETGNLTLWDTYLTVKQMIEDKLGSKGIFANIDSVTGLIYYPLGLPVESFPIPFALTIQCGWMAHCLEYIPNGRMIEPGAVYLS